MSAGHLRVCGPPSAPGTQLDRGTRASLHFGQSDLGNEAKEVRVPPVKWSAFVCRAVLGRTGISWYLRLYDELLSTICGYGRWTCSAGRRGTTEVGKSKGEEKKEKGGEGDGPGACAWVLIGAGG